jgi:hypothetical protein
MSSDRAPALATSRDLRVDLFRGIALLVIFVDHQEVFCGTYLLRRFTLVSLLYCDALEVFLFLSGYVAAIAYGKTLVKSGFVGCQRKVLGRCAQLFIANCFVYLAVTSMALAFASTKSSAGVFTNAGVQPVLAHPGTSLVRFLLMQYFPIALNLLPLYIVLLLFTPGMLWLISWQPLVALIVSIFVYSASQVSDLLQYHQVSAVGFDIFAWQLIYVIGMFVSASQSRYTKSITQSHIFIVGSAVCLLTFFAMRTLVPIALGSGIVSGAFWTSLPGESFAVNSKRHLHVIRVANALVLIHCVAASSPTSQSIQNARVLKPLIRCGQNSLNVFCFGLILNYFGAIVILPSLQRIFSAWPILTYEAFGAVALMVFASWLSSHNGKRL